MVVYREPLSVSSRERLFVWGRFCVEQLCGKRVCSGDLFRKTSQLIIVA